MIGGWANNFALPCICLAFWGENSFKLIINRNLDFYKKNAVVLESYGLGRDGVNKDLLWEGL